MHSLNQPSRPYFKAFFIDLLSRKEANSHDVDYERDLRADTNLRIPSQYSILIFFGPFFVVSHSFPFSTSFLHFIPFSPFLYLIYISFFFLRFFLSICFPLVYRLINSLFCLSSDATDPKFNSPSAVTLYTSAIHQHPKHHSEKMFNGVWNVSSQMYF